MAELFEEVVTLLESRSSTRALASQFRIESEQAASNGAVLCVPIFLSRLEEWIEDSGRSVTVLRILRSMDTNGLEDPGAAFEGRVHEPVGSELANTLLGDDRRKVASVISGEAGISERSAAGLLAPAAWAVVASIADRYGNRVDRQSLLTILNKEKADLIDGGWTAWLEATAPQPARAAFARGDAASGGAASGAAATIGGADAAAVAQPTTNYPPPVARNARPTADEVPAPSRPRSQLQSGNGRSPTTTGPVNHRRPTTANRTEPMQYREPEPRPSKIPAILGVLALFALGAGAVYWLTQMRDTEDGSAGETAAVETDGDSAAESGEATDGADTESAVGVSSEPVALDLLMFDPEGRSESTGIAELRFEPAEGQMCYNITAELIGTPYDGHIHVGPAGVRGGVVVDFGALENASIGCIDVPPRELQDILDDQAGHYVEMHDPSGEFTIRAQLSEAMDESPSMPSNSEDNVLFDPDGGGASTVVEAGRVILRGAVADQATVDRLAGELSDVGDVGLQLVNELTVVEGAPPPSGAITVDNSVLFDVGSDELAQGNTVISDVAKLLILKPEWTATVVGHTDSTGDSVANFELSFRRANAVIVELVANGVDASRLTPRGDGSLNPIADESTPEGQALNRRIDVVIDRG